MIYCPHCHRPTARSTGPCPHCGQDLSGAKSGGAGGSLSNEDTAAPASPTSPSFSPSLLSEEGAAITGSSSGLELDLDFGSDLPAPADESGSRRGGASLMGPVGVDAGFGKPGDGPLGAVLYWIRVRKRQRVLAEKLRAATAEQDRAQARSLALFALLGRRAHGLGFTPEAAEDAVSEALSAEASIENHSSRQAERHSEFESRIAALAVSLREAEAAAEPFRDAERLLQEERKQLDSRRRGCETNLKRYQIELQNTEVLSARKRESSGGEGPSAGAVEELSALEKRREDALRKIAGLDAELSVLASPVAENESRLAEASRRLTPYNDKCDAIRAEMEALKQQVAAADGEDRDAAEVENANAERSWAEAGRMTLRERVRHPELDRKSADAAAAASRASETEGEVAALQAAFDGYDRNAVRRAKQALGATAVLLVLLIVVIVIL